MPLSWSVDHSARLVLAKGAGRLSQHDIADYMTRVIRDGAGSYRALFDISAGQVDISSAELASFGQQVRLPEGEGPGGAIAIVVSSDAEHELADYFARHARAARPTRLFSDANAARAWLDASV